MCVRQCVCVHVGSRLYTCMGLFRYMYMCMYVGTRFYSSKVTLCVSLRQVLLLSGLSCAGRMASESQGSCLFLFPSHWDYGCLVQCHALLLPCGSWGSVLCGSPFLTERAPLASLMTLWMLLLINPRRFSDQTNPESQSKNPNLWYLSSEFMFHHEGRLRPIQEGIS